MATLKTPGLPRCIERALLARDRVEIAAAERLLNVLKLGQRPRRKRAVRSRAKRPQ